MKCIFSEFIDDLAIFLGITEHGKCIRELPNNICGNDGKQLYMDFPFETEKYVVDYEFESSNLTNDDLKRYQKYGVAIHEKYDKESLTYVISTSLKKGTIKYHIIGPGSKYKITIISIQEKNLEKELKTLKNKIKNNEKINIQDMLLLMFAPLMENKKYSGKIILEMAKLTNKINADEKTKNKIKSGHIQLTNRFVKDLRLKNQIKEVIEMGSHFISEFIDPNFIKEIDMKIEHDVKEGIEKGLKEAKEKMKENCIRESMEKGIEEGMKKGIEEGMEKGMERKEIEIIKNLLNKNFSTKQISDILDIPIERINKLCF